MRTPLIALFAFSAAALADTPPQPQPAAPGGVIAAAKARGQTPAMAAASPVVMETTATVAADGSLQLSCSERPNTRRAPILIARPAPEAQQ